MLDVQFETGALETYKDFIDALRGAKPGSADATKTLRECSWDGKIAGPSGHPTFTGHVRSERVRYDGVALDSLEGDMRYSPTELAWREGP